MINLLKDLRFVIGLFFAIISVILILTGLISSPSDFDFNMNIIVGAFIGCFSIVMLSLGITDQKS